MTRFKFRVWDKENKCWNREPPERWQSSLICNMLDAGLTYDFGGPFLQRLRFELVQSTGLLDCDGKEIFEGDYVQYSKEEPNKCPIFEVKFIDGAFVGSLETNCGGMRSHDMCHLKELCCDEYYVDGKANFKIIGNRFENHDILVSK